MTNWAASHLPDLTGRTAVITGATGGIGLITARELAGVGARVVLAVRTVAKGEDVAKAMPGRVEVRQLDVASLASVRAFASTWTGDLDILVNNAGIMEVPFARTSEGFETQLATNYLGPFALTNLLLPHITDRVVSVSSQLHRRGKLHLDDLNYEHRDYKPLNAYSDSKLEITLFSLELQRRLVEAGSAVRSIIAHPGIASTNLAGDTASGRMTRRLRFLFNDAEHGALPTLFAATADLPGNSYVGPNGPGSMKGHPVVRRASSAALDAESARMLWSATEELTGVRASAPQ